MTRENNHFIAVDLCVQNLRTGPVLILGGWLGGGVFDLQYLLISLEECLA